MTFDGDKKWSKTSKLDGDQAEQERTVQRFSIRLRYMFPSAGVNTKQKLFQKFLNIHGYALPLTMSMQARRGR